MLGIFIFDTGLLCMKTCYYNKTTARYKVVRSSPVAVGCFLVRFILGYYPFFTGLNGDESRKDF